MPREFPCSPFSTPLSGSAQEAEERIRNIFQYKKKRPPLLFFVLACILALSCGGWCPARRGRRRRHQAPPLSPPPGWSRSLGHPPWGRCWATP